MLKYLKIIKLKINLSIQLLFNTTFISENYAVEIVYQAGYGSVLTKKQVIGSCPMEAVYLILFSITGELGALIIPEGLTIWRFIVENIQTMVSCTTCRVEMYFLLFVNINTFYALLRIHTCVH